MTLKEGKTLKKKEKSLISPLDHFEYVCNYNVCDQQEKTLLELAIAILSDRYIFVFYIEFYNLG